MKNLTPALAYKHILKYGQYDQFDSWAKWYSKVAPYKGRRVSKVLLRYKTKNAKVLDLGCGTGMTLATLAQSFPKTVGCDIGEMEIKATKDILKKLNVRARVIKYDGDRLPFPNRYFDAITSIEVIEHVDHQDNYLQEIRRVLKKDGILHITTANKWWPVEPHFKLLFLSYLPQGLADQYVRLMGKGQSYQNIRLPSYSEFMKKVSKYFNVQDITLDVLENYKEYGLDKERGFLVKAIGKFLSFSRRHFPFLDWVVVRISLGWLLIGRPKK